ACSKLSLSQELSFVVSDGSEKAKSPYPFGCSGEEISPEAARRRRAKVLGILAAARSCFVTEFPADDDELAGTADSTELKRMLSELFL
ncbi:unnamed protein product, partial [Polarella glacialis]